jgi:serine/threonine protein kinase
VYVVYDHETHLPYAVKSLPAIHGASPDALTERFRRAAQAWISLGAHAHITPAHFMEIIDGQPLLFVEYVTGGDLRDWIGIPRLTQDLPQIVRFAMQVCDGMLHAGAHGITAHRDLKSSNCLITPQSTVKVTDMSLAAVLDGLPLAPDDAPASAMYHLHHGPGGTSTVAGTCMYMAPELLMPQQADVRADIHAFGVLLFQMLRVSSPYRPDVAGAGAGTPYQSPTAQSVGRCLRSAHRGLPGQRPMPALAPFWRGTARLAALYDAITQAPPPPLVGSALEVVRTHAGTGLASLERARGLGRYTGALAIDARHAPA